MGSAHRLSAPYQAIKCADGYINLGAANTRTWQRFAHAIGRPELLERPEYENERQRVVNRHLLTRDIEDVTRTRPRAHWLAVLEEAGVPCGPILNYAEVFNDPHIQARGMVQEMDHPVGGKVQVLGPAAKLSETPARLTRRSPLFGEHTAELMRELGYSDAEIRELSEAGRGGAGRDGTGCGLVPGQYLGAINKHHTGQGCDGQQAGMAGIMGGRQQTARAKIQKHAGKPAQHQGQLRGGQRHIGLEPHTKQGGYGGQSQHARSRAGRVLGAQHQARHAGPVGQFMQGHPKRNGPADVVMDMKAFADGKPINQAVNHDAEGPSTPAWGAWA